MKSILLGVIVCVGLSVALLNVGRSDDQASQPATQAAIAWSKPINDVAYRLRAERSLWQSWETPKLILEVRNDGYESVTVGELDLSPDGSRRKSKTFGDLRPLLGANNKKGSNPNISYCPVITESYNRSVKIEPGKQINLQFEMTELAELHSPGIKQPLTPGRYVVGMGYLDNHLRPVFQTNTVAMEILPPGAADKKQLLGILKRYEAPTGPIMAGFVPNRTKVPLGEPTFVTFVVKNLGDKPFTYAFGGDYRGTGRHDRFKIEVVDSKGNLLLDPKAGPDGRVIRMGGIATPRTAYPDDMASDQVNLLDFRKIEKPGVYTIKCRFALNKAWHVSAGEFDIPVETTYKLAIMVPHDDNE